MLYPGFLRFIWTFIFRVRTFTHVILFEYHLCWPLIFAYFYYCHWGLYDPRLLQNQHVANRQIGYCGSVLYNDIVAMLCGVNLLRIKGGFLLGFLACFVFFLICARNVCVFCWSVLAILLNYSGNSDVIKPVQKNIQLEFYA